MGTRIKTFSDGSFLEYDKGGFDDWCVYFTSANGMRNPPKDIEYFSKLKDLASVYGVNKIYNDYIKVYEWTTKIVEQNILDNISDLSLEYGNDALAIDIVFSILYMAMIAEENKKFTKLGKRIKRLGIHVLLFEGYSVHDSANFMKEKKWREIDADCRERGF